MSNSPPIIQKPDSPAKLCLFVYVLALVAVLGGFLCGYNTGIISSAMLFVVRNERIRPVSHLWQEAIVGAMPIFAAMGALFAGRLGDAFGRRKMIIVSTFFFGSGALVCASALSKWMLLCGRVLLGVALGVSSMIVPVYVGECSPTHVRGQMLSAFNTFFCFGQMAANIVAGAVAYIDPDNVGWRLMFAFASLPAVVQLVGFCFLPESPRWLFAHAGEGKSRSVLDRIYNRDSKWIDYELMEISAAREQEMISWEENGAKNRSTFVAVMKTPHVRKALLIGCSLCVFQQLSGIDTLMYYTGPLIKSAGVEDTHLTIWLSLGTSFVNFIGTVVPFLVIERFGRRNVLLLSTAATIVALLALGTSFLAVNLDTAVTVDPTELGTTLGVSSALDTAAEDLAHCLSKSNCDFCITDDRCGFCSVAGAAIGSCLPRDPHRPGHSTTGFCNGQILSNITLDFADFSCNTSLTTLPLILMVVYLLCFSIGLSTIPWVLNAEIYPLWARGTCVAVATCVIWLANAFISLTFLTFAATISRFGTFYLYAVITAFALWIFWRYVPDTSGYALDEIEFLFMSAQKRDAHRLGRIRLGAASKAQMVTEAAVAELELPTVLDSTSTVSTVVPSSGDVTPQTERHSIGVEGDVRIQ